MGEPVERAAPDGAAGASVVSESLEGLLSAVDELKKSMGLGEQDVDLSAVEQYVVRLRQENEEFQQFAEEAIMVGAGRSVARWAVAVGAPPTVGPSAVPAVLGGQHMCHATLSTSGRAALIVHCSSALQPPLRTPDAAA